MSKSKLRVVVNGVSFYTTETAIKRGVGDFSLINTAVQLCRADMGKSLGMARTYAIYDSKMNKTSYDVQISKVQ